MAAHTQNIHSVMEEASSCRRTRDAGVGIGELVGRATLHRAPTHSTTTMIS